MTLIETIESIVTSELENSPYFLVEIIGGGKSKKIQVLVDGDEGISIEQCSKISRAISKVVDDEEFEADPFILEVSSPGADLPLKNKRQYAKHVGRKLEVETAEGTQTLTLNQVHENEIEGTLVKSKKDKNKADQVVQIPFDQIVKTTVVLAFK